ncbi:disease resistance protein RPP2B-like isoform X2 [Humulus lupulus]|nr:disease resistance protein RPP2B-like isoform X2 [Humulus lupulus]
MFGIGKTTIAKAAYDRLISQFEGHYFLENVSEKVKTQRLSDLQNELFARLLGEESRNFGTSSTFVKEKLCRTKVLIVLDGVENEKPYNDLLSTKDIQFGSGSLIIVTSRSEQVLKNIKASEQYHVRELNEAEADQLFDLHAIDESSSMSEDTEMLKKKVTDYASGIPEALVSLCSHLSRCTTMGEKEDVLEKIRLYPDSNLENKMRACYDQLDDAEKKIFLDIACFFTDEDKDFVERVLNGCDLFPKIGIKNLIANSLLYQDQNKLRMNKLLQRMGREIVKKESDNMLENRSRLWNANEIRDILQSDMGTAKIEGIFLDMSNCDNVVCVSPTAFSKMRHLRLIKIYNSSSKECKVSLQGLESLPSSLILVYWHAYPMKSLPSNFAPNHLVELSMPYSKLQKLWPLGLVQHLGNLKKINLSHSEQLTQISHLFENIEIINLECCTRLVELPLVPKMLTKLTSLNLNNCSALGNILALPRNIKNLEMRRCEKLNTLPNNIGDLKELESVNLSGCNKLSRFPGISKPINRLTNLILDRTALEELPPSIINLPQLQLLSLNMCRLLQVLPESISGLDYLEKLSICHCSKLKSLPKLSSSVSWVDARFCEKLEKVPRSKLLTVTSNDIDYTEGKFAFYNCPNLDQESHENLMLEAQLRILRSAVRTRETGQNKFPVEEICLPGKEVSDWFSYNNEGNEINVPLPWSWCNHKFLGFAFCVVVEFWDSSCDSDFKLLCKSECIFPGGEFSDRWRRIWTWQCNYSDPDDDDDDRSGRVKSSHIFMFYEHGSHKYFDFQTQSQCNGSSSATANDGSSSSRQSHYYNGSSPSATFSFHPEDYAEEFSTCQVKYCGVKLLYAEDVRLARLDRNSINRRLRRESEIVEQEIVQSQMSIDTNTLYAVPVPSINTHYITQLSSVDCFEFCPNFGEICDCVLGKRPRSVNARSCGSCREMRKMMQEVQEDIRELTLKMDTISQFVTHQNLNRVSEPISI